MAETSSYSLEHKVAELAVQKAVLVTRKVRASISRGEFAKGDKTLVSLADFAAQALLVAAIHHNFPQDTIVGEEDTSLLRSNPKVAERVWELVSGTHLENAPECEEFLQSPTSLEDMLRYIDLGGTSYGGPKGRVWMIDPVDGTKGFLTGGQYVVCATLLVDGAEKVAAFGCPHISLEPEVGISESETFTSGPGYLISAVKGQGAQLRPLSTGALAEPLEKIARRENVEDVSRMRFCENVNTTSPQFPHRELVAQKLRVPWSPIHIYSTQLRYIALALGKCDVVLRMPKADDKPAHVWDHAGGILVFEEAAGTVSDLRGDKLDLKVRTFWHRTRMHEDSDFGYPQYKIRKTVWQERLQKFYQSSLEPQANAKNVLGGMHARNHYPQAPDHSFEDVESNRNMRIGPRKGFAA